MSTAWTLPAGRPLRATLAEALDRPWICAAATALVYLLLVGSTLLRHGGDPTAFIEAGRRFADAREAPAGLHVRADAAGYDGQFYYRLALDPFTRARTDFGITLDFPAYRHQRILYPILVWVLSLGRPDRVPSLMIAVNYLALVLLGGLAGLHARTLGRHALWGLLVALSPGFLMSLRRDLTEILEALFLVAGLLSLRRGRDLVASILLALAVLSRETALIAAGVVLIDRRKPVFLLPVIVFAAVQVLLGENWGRLPILAGDRNFGAPLGMLALALRPPSHRWLPEVGIVAMMAGCALFAMRTTSADRSTRMSWVFYALLSACLTRLVWSEDWAFLRALTEASVLGAMIVMDSPSEAPRRGWAAGSVALWLAILPVVSRM